VDERRDRSARGHTGRRQRPSLSPLVHDLCQRIWIRLSELAWMGPGARTRFGCCRCKGSTAAAGCGAAFSTMLTAEPTRGVKCG
jgi:hypothetical protein